MVKRLTHDEAAEVMRAVGLEPLEVYSRAIAPWRCRCTTCGAEVSPTYNNVARGLSKGCRFCANRLNPPSDAVDRMRERGFEPLEPYPGARRGWRCRCLACGSEVAPSWSTVNAGGGCRACAGQVVDPDEAASEIRDGGFEPLEPYPGADKPWLCRCVACGEHTRTRRSSVRQGKGCRFCAGMVVDPEEASATMVAAGFKPLEPYPGTNSPWPCRCNVCGREVSPTRSSVLQGKRCRYCARRAVDPDEAGEVMRAAGLEPLEPYPGADSPWRCRCMKCDRAVTPTRSGVLGGGGCAFCAGKTVDADEAGKSMVAFGFDPVVPYPGADVPWRCRCQTCQREVFPTWSSAKAGHGCGYCAGKAVDADDARASMIEVGLEPLEPYPGTNVPWRCRCMKCGNEVTPTRGNAMKQGPCRFCGYGGFDYTAPAIVYLIEHREFFALKVGITSTAARYDRLKSHTDWGWEIVQTWPVASGDAASQIEAEVLRWWRQDLGAPAALSKRDTPQAGFSETVSLLYVDADEVCRRVSTEIDRWRSTTPQHPSTTVTP